MLQKCYNAIKVLINKKIWYKIMSWGREKTRGGKNMSTKVHEVVQGVTHTHTHTHKESRNGLGLVDISKIIYREKYKSWVISSGIV